MYTLYYAPGTCSLAIHVVLKELQQKVELKKVDISGKERDPEFLKLNPHGSVPVLVDDGLVVREGAAIILHLVEKHNSTLLPVKGEERAKALEWMMFANATMHPAYGRVFFTLKQMEDSEARKTLIAKMVKAINKLWKEVDDQLAKHAFVAGNTISPADILLTVYANWLVNFEPAIELGENTKRMLKEVTSRPSFKSAMEEESVKYIAA